MERHIYSNFNPPPKSFEEVSPVQLTVPDLSLSVGQIIEQALAGNPQFPMLIEDDSGGVFDMSKSDLTDIFPNSNYGFDEDYEEIAQPAQGVADAVPATETPTAPPEDEKTS